MITINDVRDGIIAAIKSKHPASSVYDEEIKQGLRPNSFRVKMLTGDQRKLMGRRHRRAHSFDVHYFSDSDTEQQTTAEGLYGALGYIETPAGKVRATNMQHELVDDVLHFFVDYDFHVMREKDPETSMKTLKQEANFKNG